MAQSAISLECPAPNCDHKTPDVEPAIAVQLLQLHVSTNHSSTSQANRAEKLKRPQAGLDMSETTWRDFESQWVRYKRSTGLVGQDLIDQLIGCCSDQLRLDITSESDTSIDSLSEYDLLIAIQRLTVRSTNPMVHRNKLRDMKQGESESIRHFISRLKESSIDCKFSIKCAQPGCEHTTSYAEEMIRDQAVYGLHCNDTQAKILAMGSSLLPLKDVLNKAEVEEQAKFTQTKLTSHSTAELAANKRQTPYKAGARTKIDETICCDYCGQKGHGNTSDKEKRQEKCPAWDKTCQQCSKRGHFRSVCRHKSEKPNTGKVTASALFTGLRAHPAEVAPLTNNTSKVNHLEWSSNWGWQETKPKSMPKVALDIELLKDDHVKYQINSRFRNDYTGIRKAIGWQSTADTGAQVTVTGIALLRKLNLQSHDLIPVAQEINAANESKLTILGALVVKLQLTHFPENHTKQLCYVAKEARGTYLSLEACKALNLIHGNFPEPAICRSISTSEDTVEEASAVMQCKSVDVPHNHPRAPCGCPIRSPPPSLPHKLPSDDVGALKNWILRHYAASAFNTCSHQPLPMMHGEPLVIQLKQDHKPTAIHVPANVPLHLQEAVKQGLDRDVALGVIEKVPVNTPVEWLHRMVIATKKDGTPRRTVDLQPLNNASLRQTHHTPSPYHLVSKIPQNMKKTCLDAWNGYHSVQLHEESRKLTCFITPWGVYRYRTCPQGWLASGDAYTHRYDNIVKDFHNISKCIDDVCIWDETVSDNFLRTCEYLDLCSKNGIVFNASKFIFCEDQVNFIGFEVAKNSIRPNATMLDSIRNFPTPQNISGIRSFFGLINQVSYAFSMTQSMAPFRELLKPSSSFYWDDRLQNIFNHAKSKITNEIIKGVRMFDKERTTCLATDFSKEGVGFFLSQKHCECPILTPGCCADGWQLVLAGSRFTKDAESRYHPVEGEALAVAYGLQKTKYFVLGCKKLIVATDHKPLLKIFGDKKLDEFDNPRLLNFKEKTLQFNFDIIHVPGKTHLGPDSMSRNPSSHDFSLSAILAVLTVEEENQESDPLVHATVSALNQIQAITLARVEHESARDKNINVLKNVISSGFPQSKELCPNEAREFFKYRDDLSVNGNIIMYKTRVLIPTSLRAEVIESLHSGHQGVQGMKARAAQIIFWPGISAAIANVRARCRTCNTIAPTQASEPPLSPDPPQYPYEMVCIDYFELAGRFYLAMADRYSGWLSIKFFDKREANSTNLITTLREWFMTFGAPKELASDGGSSFMSEATQSFLRNWGIRHRLSSVAFPHSNCRAELAVKSAKRMIRDNTDSDGSLNTDKFARALMQYRNTPLQGLSLSPAQILLGREIRDFLPFTNGRGIIRSEWRITADDRERALARRHATGVERLTEHTRSLPELHVGQSVLLQNQTGNYPNRWDKTGVVVEIGPGPRQYFVRADGSGRVTLRNRKFLRKCTTVADPPYPELAIPSTSEVQQLSHPQEVFHREKTPVPERIIESHDASPTTQFHETIDNIVPDVPPQQVDRCERIEIPNHKKVQQRCSSRLRKTPSRYGEPVSTEANIPEKVSDEEIIWRYDEE